MPLRRLKDNQEVPRTGMVILDVGMLSGFSFPAEAAAPTDLIRRVEILPEKVTFYLDSVSGSSPQHFVVTWLQWDCVLDLQTS